MKKLDEPQRRIVLGAVYRSLAERNTSYLDQSAFHQDMSTVQDQLRKHGFDLGYRFNSRDLYGTHDETLAEDVKIVGARLDPMRRGLPAHIRKMTDDDVILLSGEKKLTCKDIDEIVNQVLAT